MRGLLLAIALAAVVFVSGCGSSRTAQATHLTRAQVSAHEVAQLHREAMKRAARLATLPPINLLTCARWRAELRNGNLPKVAQGQLVIGGRRAWLRLLVDRCSQYLS